MGDYSVVAPAIQHPKPQLVIAVTSCEANGVKAFSEYEVSKILQTLTQGKFRGWEGVRKVSPTKWKSLREQFWEPWDG